MGFVVEFCVEYNNGTRVKGLMIMRRTEGIRGTIKKKTIQD